jgi:hypothetical protein
MSDSPDSHGVSVAALELLDSLSAEPASCLLDPPTRFAGPAASQGTVRTPFVPSGTTPGWPFHFGFVRTRAGGAVQSRAERERCLRLARVGVLSLPGLERRCL